MKKYNSYFNKRYFTGDGESEDEVAETPELSEETENLDADGASRLSVQGVQTLDSFVPDTPDMAFEQETAVTRAEPSAYEFESVSVELEQAPPSQKTRATEGEATIISKSAVINGELSVQGDIHLFGKIKGNVVAEGNLEIAGKVIGNVSGNDIELSHCELKGDVNANGFVFMDKDSLMIGNVHSQDITLDGKVKGDINASRKVYVRSNAVIMGNIQAASIAIDEGAALQGQVIIANQEENEEASLQINEEKG